MKRTVAHVTLAFLPLSEAWMYDLITAPVSYEARVLTLSRENEEEFPFARVGLVVPERPRGPIPWIRDQLHRHLGWPATSANSWRRPLGDLAPTASVFHAHYGWVGWRAVEAGLSPTITSFYGVDASGAATLKTWRVAYQRLFRRGAAFVAEGPVMRDRLIALGAPAERTRIVPLVAHLDYDWQPASWRASEPVRILMAGRFVEKKGFLDGVAAFAETRRLGVDARLLLMGSGPEEARHRRAVRSRGIEEEVEFLAPQPRERFREIVRSCDILLQPSRTASDGDAEGGAPTTLLEAQALGRVVVATDHADIPHVVDPDAALLSPEGDLKALATNLTRAVTASAEWSERGSAGRRFVERNHSPQRAAALLERLYDEVADA